MHHPNGRLFAVCGDGEYVVYTAQALRNKSFGQADEFVWAHDGNYAIKDSFGTVRTTGQPRDQKRADDRALVKRARGVATFAVPA